MPLVNTTTTTSVMRMRQDGPHLQLLQPSHSQAHSNRTVEEDEAELQLQLQLVPARFPEQRRRRRRQRRSTNKQTRRGSDEENRVHGAAKLAKARRRSSHSSNSNNNEKRHSKQNKVSAAAAAAAAATTMHRHLPLAMQAAASTAAGESSQSLTKNMPHDTPHVLLWQGSSPTRSSDASRRSRRNSSSAGSSFSSSFGTSRDKEHCPQGKQEALGQEEDEPASTHIFRHFRHHPEHDYEHDDDSSGDEQQRRHSLDLLAPRGATNGWWSVGYWRQRLAQNCCLPKRENSYHGGLQQRRGVDVRPSYYHYNYNHNNYNMMQSPPPMWMGPQYHHQQQQQQQQQNYHSVIVPLPPPQISPLTEPSISYDTNGNQYAPHHSNDQGQRMAPHVLYPQQQQQQQPQHQQPGHGMVPPHPTPSPPVPSQASETRNDVLSPIQDNQRSRNDSANANMSNNKSIDSATEFVNRRGHHRVVTDMPDHPCQEDRPPKDEHSSMSASLLQDKLQKANGIDDDAIDDAIDDYDDSFMDDLSVSSLESLGSPWRTPMLQQHKNGNKMVLPDDCLSSERGGSVQTNMSVDSINNNSSGMANRIQGLQRRRISMTSSSGNKPPVPPSRRSQTQTLMSQTKHKSQVTHSTIASTALPPMPSPQSFFSTSTPTPVTSSRTRIGSVDYLRRSFSEASANTTGSMHRRGGTVCEFSFDASSDSSSLETEAIRMMERNEDASINNGLAPKPKRATMRSSSLPLEVQIRVHYVTPLSPSSSQQRHQRRPSLQSVIRMESMNDSYLAWNCTPPRKRHAAAEDRTPEGYISPLEEELFHTTPAAFAGRDRSASGPSAVTTRSTSPGAYAGEADNDNDSPQRNSSCNSTCDSNPQDDSSICQEESTPTPTLDDDDQTPTGLGGMMPRSFEDTSPFAKLKEPPAIPKGESWMWQWLNQENGKSGSSSSNFPTEASCANVTPVQSPLSSNSIINRLKDDNSASVAYKVYLPKNSSLEQVWKAEYAVAGSSSKVTIALAGWVAFGFGEALQQKLACNMETLTSQDIGHIIASSSFDTLWVSTTPGNEFDHIVNLKDCRVQVEEISRQHGRAVVVKCNNTGDTVFTMLPVCLPGNYSSNPVEAFDGSLCFPEGDYLPDDQQYTAMHIMFALDTLIKANQPWTY